MLCHSVVRNALSLAMLESLKDRLTQDVDSPDLRVIILRANGPVFSSGHNLKELVSFRHTAMHTLKLVCYSLASSRYLCLICIDIGQWFRCFYLCDAMLAWVLAMGPVSVSFTCQYCIEMAARLKLVLI